MVRSIARSLNRVKQSEDKRLRGVIASCPQRVEVVPTRESEMTELTRDYSTFRAAAEPAREKGSREVSANLERRQIGEQFQLLDPARLPEGSPRTATRSISSACSAASSSDSA